MSLTDFGSLSTAKKVVQTLMVMKAGRDRSLMMASGMIGKNDDSNRPIQLVSELNSSDRGQSAIIHLIQDLNGDGVVDDQLLEGNEERLNNETLSIQLSQLRHGVKNMGRMSDQKTVLRFRNQTKDKLGHWWGRITDELAFMTMAGMSYGLNLDGSVRAGSRLPNLAFASDVTAPSTNRKLYAGSATSTATLTASDKMSWNLLLKAKAFAERMKINPLMMEGQSRYIVLLSTESGADLEMDDDYKAITKSAGVRGPKNPLFTGELADVGGLLLYKHNRIPTTRGLASGSKYGAAGTVEGAKCLLIGAQAMAYARIGEAQWEESDNTDYKNRIGVGFGQIIGMRKSIFNARISGSLSLEDFSTVTIDVATS
ncbi:MAG: N4-gp56 family major capsid protein [Alphaproteobacteria bacterium]